VKARQEVNGRGREHAREGWDSLIPVDAEPPRTRGCDTKTTFSLTLEPPLRPLVFTQVRFKLLVASAIVVLHPLLLVLGEHTILDHLGLDGDTGKSLEAEPTLAVELVFGFDSSNGEGGFDADTPLSGNVCG